MNLNDILQQLAGLPEQARQDVVSTALAATKDMVFVPSPGPQTSAYLSDADVILFGGSPGGGKSALEIGLALNEHHRSLIVRRAFTDLEGLMDTAKKIVGTDAGFVGGTRPKYRKPDGGVIHFAGLSSDGGIGGHQGVDHDLICIDEAAQIPEKQVRLLMGWLRSDRPGQRCRVVLGSNPPLDPTGDWMIDFFGPWLNETHPNPAKPGELRYFLPTDDGTDRECDKSDTAIIGGVTVYAQSRTFIPSKFTDNPFYNAEEYAKTLAALPAEVREILVSGNFMMARKDQAWQVIPTSWVKAAQARWTPNGRGDLAMTAMALDPAGGGSDSAELARRYGGWYDEMVSAQGAETADGSSTAATVVKHRRDNCPVVVDLGGGYGGAVTLRMKDNGVLHVGFNGANKSSAKTKDGKLSFANKRAEAYWKFREELDPDQEGGSAIALPPDPELLADLCAPTWELKATGILIESKEDLRSAKRLGRSPGKGDAVVMCLSEGNAAVRRARSNTGNKPAVNMGYSAMRRTK